MFLFFLVTSLICLVFWSSSSILFFVAYSFVVFSLLGAIGVVGEGEVSGHLRGVHEGM